MAAPQDPDDPGEAEAAALRILGGAGQSAVALERRLQRRGFGADAVAIAVSRCRDLGYVDDTALARSLASRGRRANRGTVRIVAEMRGRGIDADAIAAATLGLAESEQDAAIAAARQVRARIAPDCAALDAAARRRIGAALQRRGFTTGVIVRALRALEG